jgi:hypothetical protein
MNLLLAQVPAQVPAQIQATITTLGCKQFTCFSRSALYRVLFLYFRHILEGKRELKWNKG